MARDSGHLPFFRSSGETQEERIAAAEDAAQKTSENLANLVVAFAERWGWTEDQTLSIPLRRRKMYADLYKSIAQKEKAASRPKR